MFLRSMLWARNNNSDFNVIVLNLAESSARTSENERRRFYVIAFASLREAQALIDMEDSLSELHDKADQLGANHYRLTH